MKKPRMLDVVARNAYLERELSLYQEYVFLTQRDIPDAVRVVTLPSGEIHTFKLYGAKRAAGGIVSHTQVISEDTRSFGIYYFEEYHREAMRGSSGHDAWMLRDAIDLLMHARNSMLPRAEARQ